MVEVSPVNSDFGSKQQQTIQYYWTIQYGLVW